MAAPPPLSELSAVQREGVARARMMRQVSIPPVAEDTDTTEVAEQLEKDRHAEELDAGPDRLTASEEEECGLVGPAEMAEEPAHYRAHTTKREWLLSKRRNLIARLATCEPDSARLSQFASASAEQALYHIRRASEAGTSPEEAAEELLDWLAVPAACRGVAMSFTPRYLSAFRDVLLG